MSDASHEPRSIAQLVLANHEFVHELAVRFAPWPGLAADITQQVFLEFLAKESRWDLATDVKPLLATMTRHVAARYWRERTRQLPATLQELAEHVRQLADEEPFAAAWEDEVGALRQCLDRLPRKTRALVELHYFDGASTVEMAQRLALNPGAVRMALCRIRRELHECIRRTLKGGARA